MNYLLVNPIKHGYTKDLNDYPFSSFHKSLDETGREQLKMQFKDHTEYKNLEYNGFSRCECNNFVLIQQQWLKPLDSC